VVLACSPWCSRVLTGARVFSLVLVCSPWCSRVLLGARVFSLVLARPMLALSWVRWSPPLAFAAMLARISSIVGPFPEELLRTGRHAHKYFIDGVAYERDRSGVPYLLQPKATSLRARCHTDDALFLSFVGSLLRVNPDERPTAEQALLHPWLATDPYGWPPPASPEQVDAGAHKDLGA